MTSAAASSRGEKELEAEEEQSFCWGAGTGIRIFTWQGRYRDGFHPRWFCILFLSLE